MTPIRAAANAVVVVLATFGAGGCVEIADPEHCANRDGDATCAELYSGPVPVQCSLCERFYNGCVDVDAADPLPAACRVDDDEGDGSSDGDSSAGDGAPAASADLDGGAR